MATANGLVLRFDHVHLVSASPREAARWYVEKLGATLMQDAEVLGAPQIYLSFGNALVIVRGVRPDEPDGLRPMRGVVDHFAIRISEGEFEPFCARLRDMGVAFAMEPRVLNETTSVAFVTGPDGVMIELMHRTDWPAVSGQSVEDGVVPA